MKKNNNVSYTEVSFDGYAMDRTYRNPLTIVYQYEYALYLAILRLFHSVRSRSMCIGSLTEDTLTLPLLPTVPFNPHTLTVPAFFGTKVRIEKLKLSSPYSYLICAYGAMPGNTAKKTCKCVQRVIREPILLAVI